MASAQTAAGVECEVRIGAAPEMVYDFFVEPNRMIQWMGRSAELDPRPGGTLRVDLNGRHISRGEYLELDRPHRVVFSWGWEGEDNVVQPGTSTVEVTLTPDGDGTLVRLSHTDLPEESRATHAHGWDHYLERLVKAASGGEPGEDPWGTPEGAEAAQG